MSALRTRRRTPGGPSGGPAPRTAFLFTGQGAQYAGMGAQLYAEEPAYAAVVDECAELLAGELGGLDPRELILGRDPRAGEELNQTHLTQPALFVVEYALATLWQGYGVRPAAMIGHSIGEYVAATVAGVFSLPDALRLVAARGRLMRTLPAGSMLAVQLDESVVADRLPAGVTVATVNGPGTCVVAGENEAVAAFADTLKGKCKRLRTSHAFHSPMMEPILPEFAALVAGTTRHAPRIPFVSNVTGTWITDEQATDPAYWAAHLRQPVRFGAGVATLLADDRAAAPVAGWQLLECGPGRQLANLSRMQVAKASPAQRALVPLPSLPGPGEPAGDLATLLTAAGTLWAQGVPVRLGTDPHARRTPLPTYPFERQRYWVDPDPVDAVAAPVAPRGPRQLDEWFAVPTWRQVAADGRREALGRVLVLADGPRGKALVAALRAAGADPVEVRAGDAFGATGEGFTLRPEVREDYDALVAAIGSAGLPDRVVHAFALDGEPAGLDIAAAWRAQDRGFFSVLHLTQALAAAGLTGEASPLRLDVLGSGIGDPRGGDLLRPEHATLAGLVRVLPFELPGLRIRLVDADLPANEDRALVAELRRPEEARHAEVTLRGGRRWVPDYEPVAVPAEAQPGPLKERGRYLITGGLGGIGITLAEDFAQRGQARLVLLSRSGLPPREAWDEYLAVHGQADRAGRAIAAIRRMEQAGAEVLVLAADVTDPADLRRAREVAEAEFGGVDGLVHAAGVPGGGMAEIKERAVAEQVLAPKLAGTLALAQVFGDLPLDFVALCSSITAVVGGFGQVDYCAANAFLDAYARGGHGFAAATLVSQNWGGWAEVGMAAETQAPAEFRALTSEPASRPVTHPVLTTLEAGPERSVLSGLVSAASHWVLDEHRIAGVPVVPGTAHLECARVAVAAAVPADGATAVELRDVAFLEPFAVPDGAMARYQVELTTAGDGGTDFAIESRSAGRHAVHARGSAGWTSEPPAPAVDLAAIAARCHRIDDDTSFGRGRSSLVTFGPRWDALREHYLGEAEELARIEASEAAGADLPAWGLQPALLDVATAFGRGRGEGTYLPLSYGRIVVRGPLPAVFYSYLRYRDSGTEEVVAADISLVDSNGVEIVRIDEFLLRRVDQDAVTGRLAAEVPAAGQAAEPAGGGRVGPGEDIRPADGAEAFRRSLTAGMGAQVVITTRSVADIRERAQRVTTDTIATDLGAPAGTSAAAGGSAAPRTELEETIARVWRDGLGVDAVGVDDDFFALGGNSLVAVQLIAAMRNATGVRLPMRSLFETPTIAGLAERIDELRAADESSPQAPTIPRLPRA